MSKVTKEFSRFAHQYDQHNEIQTQVARKLVDKVPDKHYSSILDIGSGSGEVYKNLIKRHISFDSFTAFDSSEAMLSLHPEAVKNKKICGDFNAADFNEILKGETYDLMLSSSALQWSNDLDFTLGKLSVLSPVLYAAVFTSNTFRTLHKTGKISSPIYSAVEVERSIQKHYATVHSEIHSYTLYFDSVREMFRYIKKSGVSSGEKKLSLKKTKALMNNYPLDHLEFEVLFVEAKNV